MTKATPKKKTTTTKKKTTVKAHRGFAHVPLRGRGRPLRGFGGDPRRRRRRPPIQQPIDRPMTPAQRDAMRRQRQLALARRRQMEALRRRQREALNPRGRPALPIRRRPTVEQLRDAVSRKKRRPHGDPGPRRPVKRRPVGDPKPKRRVTPTQRSRDRNPNTSGSPRARNPNTGGRIT